MAHRLSDGRLEKPAHMLEPPEPEEPEPEPELTDEERRRWREER